MSDEAPDIEDALTFWGEEINAQMRRKKLVLYLKREQIETEIPEQDVKLLLRLMEAARAKDWR